MDYIDGFGQRRGLLSFYCLIIISVAVLCGCGSGEAGVIGDWSGPNSSVFTFKSDHTVTQKTNSTTATGTWTLNDHLVVVSMDHVNGKTVEEAMAMQGGPKLTPAQLQELKQRFGHIELTLRSDGKQLTGSSPLNKEPISFTKM